MSSKAASMLVYISHHFGKKKAKKRGRRANGRLFGSDGVKLFAKVFVDRSINDIDFI